MNETIRNIKLQPNRRKLLEAILYLIAEGERLGAPLTQYQIVKTLFIADIDHLNRYGRPVTFDNYHAMENGPVGSEAYQILKPNYTWEKFFGLPGAPWARRKASGKAYFHVAPARPANMRLLSKSDVTALDDGLKLVRELGFTGVRDKTHEHPAYVAAWVKRGERESVAMNYAQLFDEYDVETLEDLKYASTKIG